MENFYTQIHHYIMDAERIPYAIFAIFITLIVGIITGPLAGTGNANPFLWFVIDKLIGRFGDKLDKTHRKAADLMFRGFIVTAIVILLALCLGRWLEVTVQNYPLYNMSEALLLSLLITSGSTWYALLKLYFAMEKKQVGKGAYFAIARSTRKNLAASDDFGITRCAMGYAVRSFDKGLVGPVIWYLIGGLPAAAIYSAMAALAWRFNKDGFSKGFGVIAAQLEKIMGFAPSVFTAMLLVMAGLFSPTAKMHKGLTGWMGMKNRASYEQGGFPLSIMAWSLGVSLGGAAQDITGSAIKGHWVGPDGATAQLNYKHLRRALLMSAAALFLFIVCLAWAYIFPYKMLGQ